MDKPSSDQGRRVRHILQGVAILTPLLVIILSFLQLGMGWEWTLFDMWLKQRGQLERPEEIILVAIDVDSEDSLGRYPWSRTHHAQLIRNLMEARVRVIAFDATFGDEFPEDDPELMAAIAESGITILGAKTHKRTIRQADRTELEEPVEAFSEAPYGIVDISPGRVDQVVREYPIVSYYQQGQVPQLGVQALKMYLGIPLDEEVEVTLKGWRLGDIFIPRGEEGGMFINFRGREGVSFRNYSYAVDILDDADTDIGEEWDFDAFEDLKAEGHIEGKMVFIGSTVPEHQDIWPTPFGQMPGVEIHAHAVDTILNQRFLHLVPWWFNYLLILLASVGVTLLTARLQARNAGIAGFAIVILLAITGWFLFAKLSIWMWVVLPILSAILAYSGSTVALYLAEYQEKARIRGMFQHYVASSVVDELLEHPELVALGGAERELTVLFCDVAGFTSISENLSPTELVSLLNEYLTEMTQIVLSYDGIIDKYQGDALMAEFGAPIPFSDHALKGCRAALEMQKTLSTLRNEWARVNKPQLHSRIGLNTGQMLVGNLGSNFVMDYTVMGDNVNLASRLEGANKAYNTKICISEMTYEQLEGEIICRELDLIRVKGKVRPVRIYEVLETADIGLSSGHLSLMERYEMALQLYRDRQFEEALELLDQLVELDPNDGPSNVSKLRCEKYLENPPPPDWDGVFTMTTK